MLFFITKLPKLEPREHIGINPQLPDEMKQVLKVLDVLEQKIDRSEKITLWNRNFLLILAVLFLLTNWARIKEVGDAHVKNAGGSASSYVPRQPVPPPQRVTIAR